MGGGPEFAPSTLAQGLSFYPAPSLCLLCKQGQARGPRGDGFLSLVPPHSPTSSLSRVGVSPLGCPPSRLPSWGTGVGGQECTQHRPQRSLTAILPNCFKVVLIELTENRAREGEGRGGWC